MNRWQAHRPPMAHRLENAEFNRMTYLRIAIAGVMGAPILWVCLVVFLTVLGEPA